MTCKSFVEFEWVKDIFHSFPHAIYLVAELSINGNYKFEHDQLKIKLDIESYKLRVERYRNNGEYKKSRSRVNMT